MNPIDRRPALREQPRVLYTVDGDRLVLCDGGCGTYVDELDIDPVCQRCRQTVAEETEAEKRLAWGDR